MKPVVFVVTKVNPIDNTVDLRDYNVINRCINKKRGAVIVHGDERMTLSLEELTTKCIRKQPVKSIYDTTKYREYELWSYRWIPDE